MSPFIGAAGAMVFIAGYVLGRRDGLNHADAVLVGAATEMGRYRSILGKELVQHVRIALRKHPPPARIFLAPPHNSKYKNADSRIALRIPAREERL